MKYLPLALAWAAYEFGDAYRGYQQRVSMFVPFRWLRSRVLR